MASLLLAWPPPKQEKLFSADRLILTSCLGSTIIIQRMGSHSALQELGRGLYIIDPAGKAPAVQGGGAIGRDR